MAKEEPFIARADAERVRQEIASTGEAALAILKSELQQYQHAEKLPKRWCDNFKTVADQLRRDYRLEPADSEPGEVGQETGDNGPPADAPSDPLAGFRIVPDALEGPTNDGETTAKKAAKNAQTKPPARTRKTGAA